MKRRLIPVLLALLFVLMSAPCAVGSGSLCFIGMNDSVPMYLSSGEAPYYKGNSLYVPYTVFQAGPGGVAVSYNVDKGSLVLFTRAKRLVYDLNAGTVTDEAQKVGNVEIVYRNGIVYVPVARAANHFGFSATMLTGLSGSPILRFTDGSQQLDNNTFIRKAETLISIILKQEDKNASKEDGQKAPGDEKGEEKPAGPATVYLAFAGDAVSEQTLETLHSMRVYGAFFLTQQQILENRNLVRKLFAAGHQIGITADPGSGDFEAALRAANEALDEVLFSKSIMVLLPPGMQNAAGYAVFRERYQYSVEDVLKETDTAQLYVCRLDAAVLLQRLLQEGTNTPKLLETTRIPGVSD